MTGHSALGGDQDSARFSAFVFLASPDPFALFFDPEGGKEAASDALQTWRWRSALSSQSWLAACAQKKM